MPSIGKLGLGHWAYYEQSVADGAEDYYAGAGEEQGRYIGRGSAALDLTGEVADGDLKHLFQGTHPNNPDRWLDRQHQDKLKPRVVRLPDGSEIVGQVPVATAAFDLTFSAPKSVSVLWGLSDKQVARDIKEAHESAVAQALDYLERTACITRRGKGGHRHLRGEGFVAAAYDHRSSRAGDPQLHTHVLVANATKAEGRYTALHGAALYREAKTAGYLYQAALRAELTRRLGIEWTRDQASPHPEIAGVDRELRDQFSKRADEIAEQLALAGRSGARAANAAAYDTRSAKDYAVDGLELKHRWQQEAAQLDVDDPVHALARVEPDRADAHLPTKGLTGLIDQALADDGLTQQRSTFDRRDLIQIAADEMLQGASVEHVEALADSMIDLAGDRMVLLDGAREPSPDRAPERADGTLQPDARADRPFTTRELLEHEHLILDTMRERAIDGSAKVDAADAARALDARPASRQLAPEQRTMVESITTSGDGMQVVVGLAGAGKTFSLEAANDIWTEHGIEVRGCSTALSAATNLQNETGIQSDTIARLRYWARIGDETGDSSRLDEAIPRDGVLVVDEAGMVATRELSWLIDTCNERHTKVVLVGDHHQLPEIGAGGAFAGLVHRFDDDRGVDQLTTNRRQRAGWERGALAELRSGSTGDAIGQYVARDRIVVATDPDDLRRQLAADWLQARERSAQVAMIAYTNRDVDALNQHVRRELDRRGALGSHRVVLGGREWAAGDELLCLSNNRHYGLANGTRGRVEAVDEDGIVIREQSGREHFVPRDYIERGNTTYGWATTGHKAQGHTVNGEAFVLASEHLSREWLYVAMSRATDASRIYTIALNRDPRTGRELSEREQYDAAVVDLHDRAARSSAKHMAADLESDAQRLSSRDLVRLSHRGDLPADAADAFAADQQARTARLRKQLIDKPPAYLTPLIGPVPTSQKDRESWSRDAARIEHHRRRKGISERAMTADRAEHILGRRLGIARGRGISRDL